MGGEHTVSRIIALSISLTVAGCQQGDNSPNIEPGPAEGLFTVQLEASSTPTIVRVNNGTISWGRERLDVAGAVHAWGTGPVDARPTDSLLIGLGRSRLAPSAKPTLVSIDGNTATAIDVSHLGSRITDISFAAGAPLITILGPSKKATSYTLSADTLTPRQISLMGLKQSPLAQDQLAIGRLYGPQPRSHGGLDIVAADGSLTSRTTVRGVRTLAVADIDGDGVSDLLVADGWHFRYGHDAQALLSVYPGPEYTERVPIGEIEDSYTINRLLYVESSAGGSVIALGSHSVVQFRNTPLGWKQSRLADATEQSNIAPWSRAPTWLDSTPETWLLLSGQKPQALKIP